ncbi:MAG: hypothetical protein DRJ65_09300 [Acidobacteria bacterium]|nr:MAG: hypothetical protein DRJ65_09300 [Acidobacteriota bacterium]
MKGERVKMDTRGKGFGIRDQGLGVRIQGLVVPVLAAIALLASSIAIADRDPAMERLQALGTALQTRSTWTASYAQEYVPPGMSLGERVVGQVWVAWPDKALFATGNPVVRWMGLSGRLIRLLDFENLSCDDHLLTAEEWERIPLIAVLDPNAALAQFSIVAEGERGLILIPREAGGVSRVYISIGENGLPARVVVSDPQGAVSTFDFTEWEAADGPPEGQWLPAPPGDIFCISDPE